MSNNTNEGGRPTLTPYETKSVEFITKNIGYKWFLEMDVWPGIKRTNHVLGSLSKKGVLERKFKGEYPSIEVKYRLVKT